MKDLYQCKECGFLSTYHPGFVKVNGELLCEYCARENHGVICSTNLKSSNSDYTKCANELCQYFVDRNVIVNEKIEQILRKHFA